MAGRTKAEELAGIQASHPDELDNQAVLACESGDATAFHASFSRMLDLVRTRGKSLGDETLEGSDIILPPPDVSLEEAREEFQGDGLIPG